MPQKSLWIPSLNSKSVAQRDDGAENLSTSKRDGAQPY
jgi:hypothetical protein